MVTKYHFFFSIQLYIWPNCTLQIASIWRLISYLPLYQLKFTKQKKLEIFLFDFFISKVDKPKTFFVCIIITKSFQRLYHTRCMFGYDFLIVKLFRIWIFKATTILTKITAKKKQDSLWLIEKIRGNSVFDVRDGDYCRNEEKKKRCFRFE